MDNTITITLPDDFNKRMGLAPVVSDGIRWLAADSPELELSGFAWYEQEHLFRRFPKSPAWPIPPMVEMHANHSAGGKLRFRTNSTRVQIRVKRGPMEPSDTLSYTGKSGFDLYIGAPGEERFRAVTRIAPWQTEFVTQLFAGEAEERCFTLYFPLYHPVESVEIGIDAAASIALPPPLLDPDRQVVVYGTSITQGGCASRPGMAYTNILSRRLKRHFLNFGFSGCGRGEPEVAHLLASLPSPSLYILDYEANIGDNYAPTLMNFIPILLEKHPKTPILVMSCYPFTSRPVSQTRLAATKAAVASFADASAPVVFFDGSNMLGDDFGECLVDGVHATDLAFYRMANAIQAQALELLEY